MSSLVDLGLLEGRDKLPVRAAEGDPSPEQIQALEAQLTEQRDRLLRLQAKMLIMKRFSSQRCLANHTSWPPRSLMPKSRSTSISI